jgi:phosphoribosylformimino-5-aminoimidazole carboxamide ribotide isomerase
MKIIPAIDIQKGRCVRLFQGKSEEETVYSEDPVAQAKEWESMGAERIHLVDLDGAFEGGLNNFDIFAKVISELNIETEIGGGIRDIVAIERYIEAGVTQVILGTVAQSKPEFVAQACKEFPGKIIVGIDASKGMVAIKGWKEITTQKATDLAKEMEDKGVSSIIYTDISRDGTLVGPNVEETKALAESISIPVIASGGVSCENDIRNLMKIEKSGVTGVIVGKALYDGRVSLPELIELTK